MTSCIQPKGENKKNQESLQNCNLPNIATVKVIILSKKLEYKDKREIGEPEDPKTLRDTIV